MAPATTRYFARQNYRFLPDRVTPITDSLEFNESDLYTSVSTHSNYSSNIPTATTTSRKKPMKPRNNTASYSLPVNVPVWSKILKSEYKENRRMGGDGDDWDDDEEEDENGVVPPHEILRMRKGTASVSGGGMMMSMTLKGRALSKVRNAIWEKTGFQD